MMAVTSSIGPGATNLLTAAALAHVNRLPVLLLPGDIFVLNQGPNGALPSYWQRPKPVITIRGIRGPAVPVQNPTAIPPPPSDRWWRPLDAARRVTHQPVLDGPPRYATFLYPPAQPDRQHWYVRRLAQFTAPGPRTDGPEAQALFVFPRVQPQNWTRELLVSRLVVTPQLLGVFSAPAVAQTYLYPPGQPLRAQWYVPRTPSEQVPAPLLIQQGATDTATVPIPTVGGSAHTYGLWRAQPIDPSLMGVVWSAAPVEVPFVLAPADACDTFTVAAEPGAFTVRAEVGALFVPADKGSFTVGAEPGSFTVPGCFTE